MFFIRLNNFFRKLRNQESHFSLGSSPHAFPNHGGFTITQMHVGKRLVVSALAAWKVGEGPSALVNHTFQVNFQTPT